MSSKMEKKNPKSFYLWPYFRDDEIEAVERVLRSGRAGVELPDYNAEKAFFVR